MQRLKVLALAYACEPGRGSEMGAGWSLVRAASSFANCTVLVPPRHIEAIRLWQASNRQADLRFLVVPEGSWSRFFRRYRVPLFGLYLLWLRRARAVAKREMTEQRFDVTWHVTYSTYWLPTPATALGLPSILGPVGGAVTTHRSLMGLLGPAGRLGEAIDFFSVRLMARLPATRRTWHTASSVLVQNTETAEKLKGHVPAETVLLNHAMFTDIPERQLQERSDYLVWVAALESRKGPLLAVRALAETPDDVRLIMLGAGPQRRAVERLADRLGVAERLELRGLVPRQEALALMAGAAGVIFTGLREEGGLALAEAMLLGTPTIVLGHGGAETIAAESVDRSRVAIVDPASIGETTRCMAEAMTRFVRQPPTADSPLLDQPSAVRQLEEAFRRAVDAGS